jgi:hypothetical protein
VWHCLKVRTKLATGIAAVVIAAILWVVLSPGRVVSRPFDFRLNIGKAGGTSSVMVAISNKSPNTIMYENGPVFDVACFRNGLWETNTTGRSFTGEEILRPGASRALVDITSAIPTGTKAFRVGLAFTSFSWRSELAWRTPDNCLLRPLASFLFALDRSKRSETEWSDILTFSPSVKTNEAGRYTR